MYVHISGGPIEGNLSKSIDTYTESANLNLSKFVDDRKVKGMLSVSSFKLKPVFYFFMLSARISEPFRVRRFFAENMKIFSSNIVIPIYSIVTSYRILRRKKKGKVR